MDDALLKYYNDELTYLRRLGVEFAERHPKIAGRLKMSEDTIEDPHVSRLLEGVAFLTARISHKLDEEFPEIAGSLLGIVAPDYLAPVPSMTMAQITLARDQESPIKITPDEALTTEEGLPHAVTYEPAYPSTLLPLSIQNVSLEGLPFEAPVMAATRGCKALLKVTLRGLSPQLEIGALDIDRLCFFLRGGPQQAYLLHERLLTDCQGVVIATPDGSQVRYLQPESLRPVGLDSEEAVIPYGPRHFTGTRLLAEYFLFPQKFQFIELQGLANTLQGIGNEVTLYFYLRTPCPQLENRLTEQHLAINVVPLRNYFRQGGEPHRLEPGQNEFRIVPDQRHEPYLEIHHVESVTATNMQGDDIIVQPLYRPTPEQDQAAPGLFWNSRRQAAFSSTSEVESGTETYLTILNRMMEKPDDDERLVLTPTLYCLNRDLPSLLPFGSGAPQLDFITPHSALDKATCLTAPTPTRRAPLDHRRVWQLLTHLTLNSFSNENGLSVLKKVLRLFNITQSPDHLALIDNIVGLAVRPGVARVRVEKRTVICQGADIELLFEQAHVSGHSLYPFSCVLERFFAEFCTVNRFTRLVTRVHDQAHPLARWPARNGRQVIL
ncbi:type VI secretion system baseplate subunit TssF [Mangrovitalea sediminis]|uniref:type VI secretion system baseplate subunit TssF n=1 Tax=Mangrovitalea sediminis TaxID=1982043 RepID=UPI00130425E8|nr:type VI secretion system baseplate subunit TssF [Mangrovitalea sediminis]